ncbi:MAG: cobyric acid synthase [Desulfobacterales bacterium]|nr:cobyric acid synthase [Desulfobacterales bacterium]
MNRVSQPGLELKSNDTPEARCLAVFGTGSDVGKSVVATALCQVFKEDGVDVAPYKAQNMSNNSGVTPEGLEMGRAQIVQAEAAGLPPAVDMNPILLKPTSDIGAQVVLLGEVHKNSTASEYHLDKEALFSTACRSLDRLKAAHDLVILEGAGSCAEVNLMPHDIVNMRMAQYVGAPVILVADIHKGGVFAQIVGTIECLPEHLKKYIAGFIINRFRGDISLFKDGVDWIENRTGKPVFGVLPWYEHIRIEAEDSVVIEKPRNTVPNGDKTPAIAVIRLPHISNFNDFDALAAVNGLNLHFIENPVSLDRFNAVILPGSKNTRFDLDWLHETGWTRLLAEYGTRDGHILGVCGGYQMMGRMVKDPGGLEGKPGQTAGLDLLPVETTLKAPKTTTLTEFTWDGEAGSGYEIHMGETVRRGGAALFDITSKNGVSTRDQDGSIADHNRYMGTYIHGLFDSAGITRRWLKTIGLGNLAVENDCGLSARQKEYGKLARHFKQHIDMEKVRALVGKKEN